MTLLDVQHYMSEAVKLVTFALESTETHELPELRVLDHGMGNGFFALALKACLTEVTGTEFSSDRLDFGKSNGIKTLHIDASLPENYFSLINTEQVMEHVPNPKNTIAKLVRSLKSGGIIKISVPNSRSIEKGDYNIDWKASRYSARSAMPLAPLEHLQYFPRSCRQIIAQDHGLEVVEIPRHYHIKHGTNWDLRGTIRNLGRTLFLRSMRNYFLFRKK